MIFSDEERFSKNLKAQSHNGIIGFGRIAETSPHVGPGAYFTQSQENQRAGWCPKSFTKREPMAESRNSLSSSDRANYSTALLLPSGIIISANTLAAPTPGPGHYNKPSTFGASGSSSPRKSNPNSPRKQPSSAFSTGTESRIMEGSPVCRDGVIFQSTSRSSLSASFGPGYYSSPESDLIKKSHNARVRSASKKSPGSGASSPRASPYASPNKIVGGSFLNSPSKYLGGGAAVYGDKSFINSTPNR